MHEVTDAPAAPQYLEWRPISQQPSMSSSGSALGLDVVGVHISEDEEGVN